MNFQTNVYFTLFFVLLFIPKLALAQLSNSNATEYKDDIGWSWGFYTLESAHLESTFKASDRWSGLGLGLDIGYQFKSRLGIAGRLSYRNWDDFDKTHIPLTIGPSYHFPSSTKLSFSIYGGLGPTLIWGNDYGSVFATSEVGLRLERTILQNKKIFLGTSFGQGMSFHPDHFEYLDVSLGIRF